MNSAMLDTSFLITLTSPSRTHHATAVKYYRRLIEMGITMNLSTIAIAEFEVRQRIQDLGLRNFVVVPFNIDHAFAAGSLTEPGFRLRADDQSRASVKDDVKLVAQCELGGIGHFLTADKNCCEWLEKMRRTNSARALPYGIYLGSGFSSSWFNELHQGGLLGDEE